MIEMLVGITNYSPAPLRLNKGHFMQQMTTFQLSLLDTVHAAMLLPATIVLIINETFQMSYCTKFFLRGHQNYNMSNSKVLKKDFFIK